MPPVHRRPKLPTLRGMEIAQVDIAYLYDNFLAEAETLLEQWRGRPIESDIGDPSRLIEAMGDLCAVLRRVEEQGPDNTEEPPPAAEIDALGNYGLQLLSDLSDLSLQLGLHDCARRLENLCLPLAAWISTQGGEIQQLAPVVNALAWYANNTRQPQQMAALYRLADQVFEAVSPHLQQAAGDNPLHPWRLLIINRAIVATRTLQPELMEPAFASVVELLPEDAPQFFEEGMQQMDIIGYPDPVREVMSRYHGLFDRQRTLH